MCVIKKKKTASPILVTNKTQNSYRVLPALARDKGTLLQPFLSMFVCARRHVTFLGLASVGTCAFPVRSGAPGYGYKQMRPTSYLVQDNGEADKTQTTSTETEGMDITR
ncbi:hypothetical protein RRG08_044546 [Elysia crispata]|uniref:Uncharacterized protein n=1 Tax=Elysia crispata TaxID=231223 RepID=A0AAE0ZCV2_9GAST|nr:hypothetical protein RRG08_044546 [Elysia crispata]